MGPTAPCLLRISSPSLFLAITLQHHHHPRLSPTSQMQLSLNLGPTPWIWNEIKPVASRAHKHGGGLTCCRSTTPQAATTVTHRKSPTVAVSICTALPAASGTADWSSDTLDMAEISCRVAFFFAICTRARQPGEQCQLRPATESSGAHHPER
jgi:hypothetical protein